MLTAAVCSGMVGGAAVDDCVGACLLVGLSFVGEGWEGAAGAGIYIQTVLVGVSTGDIEYINTWSWRYFLLRHSLLIF